MNPANTISLNGTMSIPPTFNADCRELIGALRGKVIVRGNILTTGVRWNAES